VDVRAALENPYHLFKFIPLFVAARCAPAASRRADGDPARLFSLPDTFLLTDQPRVCPGGMGAA
jgi:hypothetical protein